MRLRKFQLHWDPNRRHRCAGARTTRPARSLRDSRDACGHDGEPDVRFHRRNVYMSAKRTREKTQKKKIAPRKSASASKGPAIPGEFERSGRAAEFIFSQTKLRPQIALVLGSGLGAFADEFTGA